MEVGNTDYPSNCVNVSPKKYLLQLVGAGGRKRSHSHYKSAQRGFTQRMITRTNPLRKEFAEGIWDRERSRSTLSSTSAIYGMWWPTPLHHWERNSVPTECLSGQTLKAVWSTLEEILYIKQTFKPSFAPESAWHATVY